MEPYLDPAPNISVLIAVDRSKILLCQSQFLYCLIDLRIAPALLLDDGVCVSLSAREKVEEEKEGRLRQRATTIVIKNDVMLQSQGL